jgi:putative ABC transport system permease protein
LFRRDESAAMISWLNQVVQITLINLRNVPRRLGTSLVVVVGIAGVVGVLVSVLAMSYGFRHTLASTGRGNRVIMLRAGSDSELSSGVPRDQATLLATLPGIARDADGRPLASAELVVMVDRPRRGESDPNNVPFRGVQPAAFRIRDEVRIVAGRAFSRAVREVIVGKKAARQFEGLGLGSTIGFRDSDWTVVGIFESGGDVHESEIWADAEVAMSAFRRTGYQSLTATVAGGTPADLAALREAVARDRRFTITVLREPAYYAKQAKVLSTLIDILGYTVAGFMAVGAMFGALNCMYSAIASRQVEIATLRAIGFGGAPVVVSVMIEALLLALAGGGVGGALAYLYCDGASLATLNFSTFSQVAFDMQVTPGLLGQGLLWSLVIGAAGGLPPAIRAARLPVTVALRAV